MWCRFRDQKNKFPPIGQNWKPNRWIIHLGRMPILSMKPNTNSDLSNPFLKATSRFLLYLFFTKQNQYEKSNNSYRLPDCLPSSSPAKPGRGGYEQTSNRDAVHR